VSAQWRRPCWVIGNCVTVFAPQRREASVKTNWCFFDSQNSHVTGESLVHAFGGEFSKLGVIAAQIKVDHLRFRVHSSIRAAGNNCWQLKFMDQCANNVLKLTLNRAGISLGAPTVKARTVIGNICTQTNQPVPWKTGNGLINIVLRVQELLLGLCFCCRGFFSRCLFFTEFIDRL